MERNKKKLKHLTQQIVLLLVLLSCLDAILTPTKCQSTYSLCKYMSKIILNPTVTREDPHISRKKRNKRMKIINGNRNKPREKKKHYHRIAIWNKASSHLQSSFPGFPIIKQ